MKNIFKSLMLVAVAAMAFTACQKDIDETNKKEQTRVVTFTATIGEDDTRSGFTGTTTTEDGKTAYKSSWDGGETLGCTTYGQWGLFDYDRKATISNDGKFDMTLPTSVNSCIFYSPDSSWTIDMFGKSLYKLPSIQTPRTDSVDPAAHILMSEEVKNEGDKIAFKMNHVVAYGKMTINTPNDFKITKVIISITGSNGSYDYILNVDNVEDNTFWFATEPTDVTEFTIKAYGTGETVMVKTVHTDKLQFQTGRVSTFSVSDLVETIPAAVPTFTNASSDGTSGDCFVTFTSEELGTLVLNAVECFVNSTWPVGEYSFGQDSGVIYTKWNGEYMSTYNGYGLNSGKVYVSVKDGLYHIEFVKLADESGNILLENATYTGEIPPLVVPN